MTPKRWLWIGIGAVILLLAAVLALGHASASGRSVPSSALSGEGKGDGASEAAPLLAKAERLRVEGSLLEARQLYQQILQQYPQSSAAATVQQQLGLVNLKLILSATPTPESVIYEVKSGDTLLKIAREFHTTVELVKASNGLTSDWIRPDQRLKVVKANFSVVVDKSQNSLTLKNGEEVLKVYRCSTGVGGITPVGSFRVVNRIIDPPWFTPQGVLPSGDPRNVLGSRWLGFDIPGYGIHGTTDPESIGKPVTQGCVRLANSDVEELFTLLPEGTPVTIVE